jgi:hypothetical protein
VVVGRGLSVVVVVGRGRSVVVVVGRVVVLVVVATSVVVVIRGGRVVVMRSMIWGGLGRRVVVGRVNISVASSVVVVLGLVMPRIELARTPPQVTRPPVEGWKVGGVRESGGKVGGV